MLDKGLCIILRHHQGVEVFLLLLGHHAVGIVSFEQAEEILNYRVCNGHEASKLLCTWTSPWSAARCKWYSSPGRWCPPLTSSGGRKPLHRKLNIHKLVIFLLRLFFLQLFPNQNDKYEGIKRVKSNKYKNLR